MEESMPKLPESSTIDETNSLEHKEFALSAEDIDDSIETTPTGKTVWLVACTVSMGGFLFGYDTGVISAVLVNLGTDLGKKLSSSEQELITSITSGGALIGAVIAGLTSDKYGRKLGIYLGCFVFFAGAVIQAGAYSLAQMTVGRFIIGIGVGSAAMIIPLYIGEMAPARSRGRLIVFDNLFVAGGQLVSYALGAGFTEVNHGWRYMVGLGAAPAMVLAAMMPWCPESPRQLISHGKIEDARITIGRIWPNAEPEQVNSKINLIQLSIEESVSCVSDKTLWWQIKQLFTVPANLRALTTACAVMAISQLGGFNTLMYYSSTLFGMVGFNKPVAVSIVVGATNFLFGFVNFAFIDRYGRRVVLLITVLGMSLSLVLASIAFNWIPVSPSLTVQTQTINWAGILLLVMIIVYVAFFAAGVAPIAWVGTELLPLEVRALGTMMNTVTCWACNIIISSTFLSMMKGMTPSGAFGFYAGICFAGWVFVVFCYAEVHGMNLEEVRGVYKNGFGVKEAKRKQREMREMRMGNNNSV